MHELLHYRIPDDGPAKIHGDIAKVADGAGGMSDLNGDVTSADARLVLRAAVGLEDFESGSLPFLCADVDYDGTLSAAYELERR